MAGNWQFFCCGGKFSLRPEKKKFQLSVWRVCQFLVLVGNRQFYCCGGKFSLRPEKKSSKSLPEKKDTVVCLAGARSITTGKKKDTVVCLMGARFWRLRPEKKDTVVCLLGAWFWRLRPEKKKIQSSVWRVVLLYQFLVLAGN